MLLSPDQCRAARALIKWPRKKLSKAAGITERTITDFEREAKDIDSGIRIPRKSTLLAIKASLESAGVEFIPENGGGPGVRLRETK